MKPETRKKEAFKLTGQKTKERAHSAHKTSLRYEFPQDMNIYVVAL